MRGPKLSYGPKSFYILKPRPVETNQTCWSNIITHCWTQHVLPVWTAQSNMLDSVGHHPTFSLAWLTTRHNFGTEIQQCWMVFDSFDTPASNRIQHWSNTTQNVGSRLSNMFDPYERVFMAHARSTQKRAFSTFLNIGRARAFFRASKFRIMAKRGLL